MTEPDLHVPAKAMEELLELNADANVHDARRIATSIVAAELRRLANELTATGRARVGRHVRSRADQLDGGAS